MVDQMMMQPQQGLPSIPTPTAMIIKQARMSPVPGRRMQPSPTPSRRSVVMRSPQLQRPPSIIASPLPSMLPQRRSPSPQPSVRSGFQMRAQRPPSVVSRHISPPSSPMASPRGRRRMPASHSPPPVARVPSPLHSQRASVVRRSPPPSPRTSFRQPSPPSSPRVSMRRQSPPPSPSPARSPFVGRRLGPQSPPLVHGHISPSHSPQLSRRPSPSPSPSRRSVSPAGPPLGRSSPTFSRSSTRLLRDPTPLARPRMGGHVPLGTVRPSPMGLRGRPVPPPTQNVRPFRASSIRSNRSSVLTIDSSLASPFHSPHMVHRVPLRRKESGRLPSRPVARGRPLMARQSMRSMPPASPQVSLKRMPPPASPRLSPGLSRQSSPHLHPRSAHPPTYAPEMAVEYADPYYPSSPSLSTAMQNQALREASYSSPLQRPVSPYDQPMAPSSPLLSGALQNQVLRDASFVSPLQRPVSPHEQLMAPSSPYLSNALQNQIIRDASYASPLQRPMSPYEQPVAPSSPLLSGALQNQALRDASYASPLQRSLSPNAPSVPSSPMLSGAMRHSQAVRGMATYQTPQLRSPYGPTVVTPYDYISEPGPGTLLHDALQNRSGLQNVSSLRSPMMPRRTSIVPANPQLHSALSQNPNLRLASYQTPLQMRRSSLSPSSPMLGNALQNQQLMQASYRLPDGSLVSPYGNVPSSPMLGSALQNQQIRGAAFSLPDGSVIRVIIKGQWSQPLSWTIT